ncbi:phosphopantetheine-binding protein [Streptomyces sp. TRM 70351]|uniref:acyl carrier protein n=1 Tax=Streptomyces sp. TRM 70351 TaxID=3116552 RepID=UPI002E7B937C|nr:phosphopantetheine-binding protein [Streptomyces sp. TRM 70351]MEE1928864.1 phosphopantetheine-binding protein [Streptomyces sp. TRM 70351]
MPPLTPAQVTRAVHEAITAVLPTADATQITLSSSWEELEADSVDRVEILCNAADNLGLPTPDPSLESAPTVGALVQGILAFNPPPTRLLFHQTRLPCPEADDEHLHGDLHSASDQADP